MRRTFTFKSFNETDIHGVHWYHQKSQPASLMVVAHGMMETIQRYHEMAEYLVAKDIFVYGHDHRGHGKTAGDQEHLGDLGENGWIKTREDLKRVVKLARHDYPGVPIFFLGHSMGSFLVRDLLHQHLMEAAGTVKKGKRYAPREGWTPRGVVLSGTGKPSPAALTLGKWIAGMEMKWKGPLHRSKRLYDLTFGKYNKRIDDPRTYFDWLSRDETLVEKYMQDPYCGQVHTSRFYNDFFHHLKRILYKENHIKASGLSMLLVSGQEDPVGDYGEAVVKTSDFYEARGFSITTKIYPGGRHEMFNETNKTAVYEDLVRWINQCQTGPNA